VDVGSRFARNVDWNLFKVFYEIARCQSIGAAARSLNRQQPSVSAALKRLESHIGVKLCRRTSRGIDLTVFGQTLYAACEGMYSSVRSLPNEKSVAEGDFTGVVTLRVISNLHLVAKLNEIFADFHRRCPKIEIKLDVTSWPLVLESLNHGDVEVGIGFNDMPNERLISVPILQQVQQLYCGPNHRLFRKRGIKLSDLQEEAFVITKDEPKEYGQFRERHDLGRQVGGVADNVQERMWLIQLGMGIGFLPKPIVDASSFSGMLWPLLPASTAPVATIYFMASRGATRSAPAQLLLDTVLRHTNTSAADAA